MQVNHFKTVLIFYKVRQKINILFFSCKIKSQCIYDEYETNIK